LLLLGLLGLLLLLLLLLLWLLLLLLEAREYRQQKTKCLLDVYWQPGFLLVLYNTMTGWRAATGCGGRRHLAGLCSTTAFASCRKRLASTNAS
jgi:hypothetical protein